MKLTKSSAARTSQGERLVLLLTGFVTAWLYYQMAAANFSAIWQAIRDGVFYVQSDFGVATWQAGLALRAGDIAGLYYRHWLYPPPMALPVMGISLLPLPAAFWIWCLGTNLLAAGLLRFAGLGWPVIALGLLGPAMLYNNLLGQNGALTGGFLVASLLLVQSRPLAGGALAGILCIKPQIAILLPAVLLRRPKAIASCVLAAAVLAGAATWITGIEGWKLFLHVAQPIAHEQLNRPFGEEFQMASITVFIAARSFGCGLAAAWAMQAVASFVAFGMVWVLWGKPAADNTARMAATICLSMLAVPFGFTYDLIGFSVAMAALGARAPVSQMPVFAGLWLWPGLTILLTTELHLVLMPVAAVIGAVLAWGQLHFDPGKAIR